MGQLYNDSFTLYLSPCIELFSLFFNNYSRRRAFSPQTFVSQDSEDSDSEPSSPFAIMTTPDSGSKIERILGRRVLPNTEEEAYILKYNRLAIVYYIHIYIYSLGYSCK